MQRFAVLFAGVSFLFALIPSNSEAQVLFGPQVVVWDFEEVGVGARVDFGLGDAFGIEEGLFQNLFGTVNGNYVFQSDITTILINANTAVPFQTEGAVTPYAGAGVNHLRYSNGGSVSWSGLNLLGGIFFDLGNLPAFGELQYSTTGSGFLSLSGGVLFGG